MAHLTIGVTDARANFNKLTNEVAKTGQPVTIYKNNKPFVVVSPASYCGITNAETIDALEQSDQLIHDEQHQFYGSVEDFMDALDKAVDDA